MGKDCEMLHMLWRDLVKREAWKRRYGRSLGKERDPREEEEVQGWGGKEIGSSGKRLRIGKKRLRIGKKRLRIGKKRLRIKGTAVLLRTTHPTLR